MIKCIFNRYGSSYGIMYGIDKCKVCVCVYIGYKFRLICFSSLIYFVNEVDSWSSKFCLNDMSYVRNIKVFSSGICVD